MTFVHRRGGLNQNKCLHWVTKATEYYEIGWNKKGLKFLRHGKVSFIDIHENV